MKYILTQSGVWRGKVWYIDVVWRGVVWCGMSSPPPSHDSLYGLKKATTHYDKASPTCHYLPAEPICLCLTLLSIFV